MIIEQKSEEYRNIICEYLFIKSKFIKNKEYVISENKFIS